LELNVAFRGILFDKDGTLIEADGAWVPFYRRQLMRMMSIESAIAEKFMSLAGYDVGTGRVTAGSIMAGGTTRQLVDIWWPDHSAEERTNLLHEIDKAAQQDVKMEITPITDLAQLLTSFRERGWKVGIATNDSMISTKRQVADLGIGDLLDAIITNDTVETPKPSGDMIRRFQTLTGIHPSEIVMVGDNFHDIEEARRGGAGLAVAVLSGNGRLDDLAHLADLTLRSIAELPAYFGHD
jgi:phosphoglycolate phosphatase